jgi:selenoprotein W-related protein
MVSQILNEFQHDISDLKLIPSRGGVFELVIDGDLVYSKKETGRHAEPEDILGPIRERV